VRDRAYWLFALVAWPASVWGCIEIAMRLATRQTNGLADALMVTSAAAVPIALSRWRRNSLGLPEPD
jgi:hypothetical protein